MHHESVPDDAAPPPKSSSDLEGVWQAVTGDQVPAEPHKHYSDPCQHAYANFRTRILAALTKSRRNRRLNGAQFAARAALLLLDVPARWVMNLADTVIGSRGYFTVGSVLAVYLAVFGLIDAKATQEETRASVERGVFMTLVSGGNAASFVAAMKDFGPTQTMRVTEHPSWFKFWEWGRAYPDPPNRLPMWHWAQARLGLCKEKSKDCSLQDGVRLDLGAADLRGAFLRDADLGGAYLTGARLRDADLGGAYLAQSPHRLIFGQIFERNMNDRCV